MDRRIVLEHAGGTLAGMCQISGREADLQHLLTVENLPPSLWLQLPDRRLYCTLIRTTDRYILYREGLPS